MTNHVHLLVTPDRADAILWLIIAFGRRYVQYLNTTYHGTGALWGSSYGRALSKFSCHSFAFGDLQR